jgi:hypothetical protein
MSNYQQVFLIILTEDLKQLLICYKEKLLMKILKDTKVLLVQGIFNG